MSGTPESHRYEVEVRYDDNASDWNQHRAYYDTLEKYHASGMGHEKTGTSTMIIESNMPVTKRQLKKDLDGIEIVKFKKF